MKIRYGDEIYIDMEINMEIDMRIYLKIDMEIVTAIRHREAL